MDDQASGDQGGSIERCRALEGVEVTCRPFGDYVVLPFQSCFFFLWCLVGICRRKVGGVVVVVVRERA